MLRRLLRNLGAIRTTLLITACSSLSSLLLYLLLSYLLGRVLVSGIVMSTLIPILVAPFLSYFLLKILIRLDGAEQALTEVNSQLELRVERRTAELVEANRNLQAEISERKRAEAEAEASLQEKEVLLKEIHHRVKNNLQIISSMLRLQSGSIVDQKALAVLQDSQDRVRSMSLIHEKLYRSKNLAKINLAEYIQDLSGYLFATYCTDENDTNIKIQADPVFMGIDLAVPCGLILNELMSNALKHAFPQEWRVSGGQGGAEIRVGLHELQGCQVSLTVGDNGVGLPADWDTLTDRSLGLQMVNLLVEQIDGNLEVNSNGGAEFRVAFAVP